MHCSLKGPKSSRICRFPLASNCHKVAANSNLEGFCPYANQMQQSEYLVEMTLYDTIRALKDIIIEEVLERGPLSDYEKIVNTRGFNKVIANIYSGCQDYADSTLEKLVGVVKNLQSETVEALGTTTTVEEPELMRTNINQLGDSNGDNDAALADARVYRNLISASALRGASVFREERPELQILALRRLRNRFRLNNYRGFSADVLNSETGKAGFSVSEKEKMERAMGSTTWHRNMKNILANLLETDSFDREVEGYKDNKGEVIPSL